MLFLEFSNLNLLFGILWVVFRSIESLMQIYNKIEYWKLLKIGKNYIYLVENGHAGKSSKSNLVDSRASILAECNKILSSKDQNFSISQVFFSLGTFFYSLTFTVYGINLALGIFGILSSLIYCLGNIFNYKGLKMKVVWNIGGLLILIYELVLAIFLIFFV